jgi:hypothetical protein
LYLYIPMQKFVITILAVIYMGTSIGATVQLHYCMDKLVGWGLTNKLPEKCGKCGMSKQASQGCCHDEQKEIKIATDQKISEASFTFSKIKWVQPLNYSPAINVLYLSRGAQLSYNNNSPPRWHDVNTYIYICVFRI